MSHIRHLAQQCRDAARSLATLSTDAKRRLLETMAVALDTDAATILAANAADLDAARTQQVGTAMLDRLALTPNASPPWRMPYVTLPPCLTPSAK